LPAGARLRAKKAGAHIIVDANNVKASIREQLYRFRTNQTTGAGYDGNWHIGFS
jgi:hypothetical protein